MKEVIKTILREGLLFENQSNNKFIFGKSSNGELITLYSNNQMVGDIEISYSKDIMEISQLDILPKYRGKGYAKLLMNKAITLANKKGISKIVLEPEPMDSKGLDKDGLYNFYGKFGFTKTDNGKMELIIDKTIKCENCGWTWKESESSKEDLYNCHKCGYDNKKCGKLK
jgi:GNAT superfamily N-acetyltransferase